MDKQQLLDKIEVFLLDMDGTVYLGNKPIGDMKNTLHKLVNNGKRLIYLTNNSSKTHDEYIKKLSMLGYPCDENSIYSSSDATIYFLKKNFPNKKVYLVASDKVKEMFINNGIVLVEDGADVCVLAYDMTITYEKIKKFNEYLVKGTTYIATHPDNVCPTDTVSMPDLGSFFKLFEVSSGRKPDYICGKPFEIMGEAVQNFLGVSKDKVAMVGDRLCTDIAFGVNAGFTSVMVLSGEATMEDLKDSPCKPHIILNSLNDLGQLLK